MKKTTQTILVLVVIALVAFAIFYKGGNEKNTLTPIRVGWQPPWTNQGQIAMVLKYSNILELNGLKGEFMPFTYGGPMTEAALTGEIDVMFAGSQPVINLISKDKRWKIVARMANYRSAIVVPMESPIKDIKDLKGKIVATAFGSTTHRETVRILKEAGLDPITMKDVQLKNLDQAEHTGLIQRGKPTDKNWAGIDAISTYDPTAALVVSKGLARIVKDFETPAVVAMREDFIQNRRQNVINFLKSYIEAFYYYAIHQEQADSLYATEARIDIDPSLYKDISAIEPNMRARSINDVNVALTEDFQKVLQRDADLALELKILKNPLVMTNQIDSTLMNEAVQGKPTIDGVKLIHF